ncbi:MAG: anti-sigma factor family protein [Burkholderiaceae bacterium]
MDHKESSELLPAYIDQELDISDALAVERHLRDCAECQHDYAQQSSVKARFRQGVHYINAPAHLAERIQSALPQDAPRLARSRSWNIFRDWNINWLNRGAAMATLLAALWSVGLYVVLPTAGQQLAEEVIASHARSLQVDHLSDVASSDQHTVKPWFNGKLDFSPPVADLAAQGFPLVGGRLDYLDGHPVAALIYRRDQHPINVYIWPSAGKDSMPQRRDSRGYHLLHWNSNGMEYWAISDVAENELAHFAEIMRLMINR